jgi:hypothetical protein
MKKIIGGVITLVIGGTIFTVSKADIAKNFSKDTGLSQEEAQQYVENIKEDDMVSYDKLGSDFISDGQDILKVSSDLDCINYSYKWETNTLSCNGGKSQLNKFGDDEIALGKAYTALSAKTATKADMSTVISLIDKVNADLRLEIVSNVLNFQSVDEIRKTNSYNKALLQSALESK